MCGLCSDDKQERSKARDEASSLAEMLRRHAMQVDAMARGDITPHTDAAKAVGITARCIVRELVAEWV